MRESERERDVCMISVLFKVPKASFLNGLKNKTLLGHWPNTLDTGFFMLCSKLPLLQLANI